MQKKFISLLILSVFVLSIFSVSLVAAAQSDDCNLWCRIVALFTGKMPATGSAITISESSEAIRWTKTYGGPYTEEGNSVRQTSDGGYILVGYTTIFGSAYDIFLLKIDSSGNQQWNKTFGGMYFEYGNSVEQTSDGGYIITGYSINYNTGTLTGLLIKTNSSGDQQWSKTFDGIAALNSAHQTPDGGYIMMGYDSGYYARLIKTDSAGNISWSKTLRADTLREYGRIGNLVQQTPDGGYITMGSNNNDGIWLIKINPSGGEQWTSISGNNEQGNSIQLTSGGYIIIGENLNTPYGDILLRKVNTIGYTQWTKTFGGGSYELGSMVENAPDGYIIAGSTMSFGAGSWDAWVIRTNSSGDEQWNVTIGGGGDDKGNSIIQASNTPHSYILAGSTRSYGAGDWDVLLADVVDLLVCGNGINESGEACDSDAISCTTPQGYAGTKTCFLDCSGYDACSTTQYCGNTIKEGPEACDSDAVSCTTPQGYSGTQTCLPDCSDYGECTTTQYCGDGAVNNGEQCDDGAAQTPVSCGVGACARTIDDNCVNCQIVACVPVPGTSLPEICNNIDDDCDGQIDEELTRATTCGLGACVGNTGIETCSSGNWISDTCNPFNGATAEVCDAQSADEDCDGSPNEECNCVSGATESCYEGAQGTNGVGLCHAGTKTCVSGQWGTCDGVVYPADEICDNFDNDCDGSTNEENVCCGNEILNNGEVCDGGQVTCASLYGTGWIGTAPCKGDCSEYDDSSCQQPPSECHDTDGGRNYTVLGTATNFTFWHSDGCFTTNQPIDKITEYYCVGDRVASEVADCPADKTTCYQGRCMPEFTTIGAGIALIGASAGYALIRRKRK